MSQQEDTKTASATPDMNLAAYIKVIKKIDTAGHYLVGTQLWVRFKITPQQLATFKEEYLNSNYAIYDATKRNFLRLLAK